MARALAFVLLLVLGGASSAFAGYEAALRAFDQGDLELAKQLARPAAEAGDMNAQFLLGAVGLETAADDDEAAYAVRWLVTAAERGHVQAAYEAGIALFDGDGVPEDRTAAAALFGRAAQSGHGPAAYRLAMQYEDGDGTRRDIAEAERWYVAAARAGLAEALIGLHEIYLRLGDRIAAIGTLLAAEQRGEREAALRLRSLRPAPSATERSEAATWVAERWPTQPAMVPEPAEDR